MAVNQTTTLLKLLNFQAGNLITYPNIQPNTFDSLQRQLLRYKQRTYGVNFLTSGATSSTGGTPQLPTTTTFSGAANQSPTITDVQFLVIAVHGTIDGSGADNSTATGRNIVYIANHLYSFAPGTPLTLNTRNNINKPVTVMRALGSGAFEVHETLKVDILTINSGGADINAASSFPYVLFTPIAASGNNANSGLANTSVTGGDTFVPVG